MSGTPGLSDEFKVGSPVFLRVFGRGVDRGVVARVCEDHHGFRLVVRLDTGHLVHTRPGQGDLCPVDAVTLLGELLGEQL